MSVRVTENLICDMCGKDELWNSKSPKAPDGWFTMSFSEFKDPWGKQENKDRHACGECGRQLVDFMKIQKDSADRKH